MGHNEAPLSYEEMRRAFRESLDCTLSGAAPTPVSDRPQTPFSDRPQDLLMLALLDITHAVRESRPTEELVTRAFDAFTAYAAEHDEAQWLDDKAGIDVW